LQEETRKAIKAFKTLPMVAQHPPPIDYPSA
jgi:hypothetical protein